MMHENHVGMMEWMMQWMVGGMLLWSLVVVAALVLGVMIILKLLRNRRPPLR